MCDFSEAAIGRGGFAFCGIGAETLLFGEGAIRSGSSLLSPFVAIVGNFSVSSDS